MSDEVEITTDLAVVEEADFAVVFRNVDRLPPGAHISVSITLPDAAEPAPASELALSLSTLCPRCGLDLATLPERLQFCPRCNYALL